MELSRRDLFKFGGIAAVGAAGAGMLAGCSPSGGSSKSAPAAASKDTDGLPSFFQAPEPIKDVKETKEFDVVVIGAGAAGVPCALAAADAGAKVALIQKESQAVSQGNTCDSLEASTSAAGKAAVMSWLTEQCAWRSHRDQLELWANNSGEALHWLWDKATEAGCQVVDTTKKWTSNISVIDEQPVSYFAFDFGPKPYNTGNGMRDLCDYYNGKDGLEIFYSCPAEQLVKDGDKVVGVICKDGSDYVQFNAKNGVVVATGDYTNDDEMMAYYNPDMNHLDRKETNKTGDGQKMMVWAGGRMESVCGSKVQHDFDAGPGSMADMPFLTVKNDGTRFCNEARSAMAYNGNFLTSEEDNGYYTQVFDSNYMTDCADWPGKLYDPEAIKAYMPEEPGEKKGVYPDLAATFKADTIEELGKKLGLTDVDAFVKTVARYNELVDAGVDEDMGKPAKWLKPIKQAPFYGIHRHIRLSTIVHGVNVNGEMQVLDKDGNPIEGLYSIGNCAGNFFGSPDYPMDLPGLSLGRCHTQGYVVGKMLGSK